MICCPFAVNKCPFKRTYFSIISKECLVFGNIICCPFRMHCLALFSVPLDPKYTLIVVSLDSVTPTERLLSIRQKDIKSNNKTVRKESLRKGLSSLLIKSVMKGKLNPTWFQFNAIVFIGSDHHWMKNFMFNLKSERIKTYILDRSNL